MKTEVADTDEWQNVVPTLESLVSFPLYAAAKETVKLYRPLLDGLNLTYTQYIAMVVFWEHKKLNVKELGERVFLDSGTLTPVLKSLEAKGYVRRYRSTEDERVLFVEVTELGDSLKERAPELSREMVSRMMVSLSHDEFRTLYHLLYKLLDGIKND